MIHPIPPGTRDILPDEMRELRNLGRALIEVFEARGYGEVATPAIQREVAKALNSREVRERLEATGNEVVGSTPEEFDAKFKADLAKFAKVVREARVPAQD